MQDLTIVKVGGKVVEEADSLFGLLNDFVSLPSPKILVHGGGRSATSVAARLGIETKMVEGRRITDGAMLEVVTMVYGGLVNKGVVSGMQARGCNALGMTGADMNIIQSVKRTNSAIDYGFVGDIKEVNANAIDALLKADVVPVIAPLTHDGNGQLLNTNADTMASALASAMSALYRVTLVFCFELPGVLKDIDNPESVISIINPNVYENLKRDGVVADGMIPKLDNSFDALKKGVYQIKITNTAGLAIPSAGTVLKL
ncbi:acetylglutamate kinase [Natronoflexus pectinivorans]|uniref:Acetylglutamate kinase n=1 Tax=Natronoflexus pectinivorans TaxID=682526 RepID=A0A4R2GN72_9BACT|nr:acetylglutamate kinase [Natronoflexus pectinivorans]TCO10520.1 N-acetylglutamate kinase [Natronoflexus pectinivorans]